MSKNQQQKEPVNLAQYLGDICQIAAWTLKRGLDARGFKFAKYRGKKKATQLFFFVEIMEPDWANALSESYLSLIASAMDGLVEGFKKEGKRVLILRSLKPKPSLDISRAVASSVRSSGGIYVECEYVHWRRLDLPCLHFSTYFAAIKKSGGK